MRQRGDDAQLPNPLDFADADLPVHLDIGCARGRWLLQLGDDGRRWSGLANHVGVEIRSDLVKLLYTSRRDLVADYPTYSDRKLYRLPTRQQQLPHGVCAGIGDRQHLHVLPLTTMSSPSGTISTSSWKRRSKFSMT